MLRQIGATIGFSLIFVSYFLTNYSFYQLHTMTNPCLRLKYTYEGSISWSIFHQKTKKIYKSYAMFRRRVVGLESAVVCCGQLGPAVIVCCVIVLGQSSLDATNASERSSSPSLREKMLRSTCSVKWTLALFSNAHLIRVCVLTYA